MTSQSNGLALYQDYPPLRDELSSLSLVQLRRAYKVEVTK